MKRIATVLVVFVLATTYIGWIGGHGKTSYQFNRYGANTPANRAALRSEFKIGGQVAKLLLNLGYTAATLSKVQTALGIDIVQALTNPHAPVEVKALMADAIAYGVVTKLEPIFAPPFHSVVYFDVKKWYRNDYGVSTVPILLANGREGDAITFTTGLENLRPGDTVYVFLSAAGLYVDMERNFPRTLTTLQQSPQLYFQIAGGLAGGYNVYRMNGPNVLTARDGSSLTRDEFESKVSSTTKLLGR